MHVYGYLMNGPQPSAVSCLKWQQSDERLIRTVAENSFTVNVKVIHETYFLQTVKRLSSLSMQAPKCCHSRMDHPLAYPLRDRSSFSVGFNNSFSFTYCQHTFELGSSYRYLHHGAVQQCPSWRSITFCMGNVARECMEMHFWHFMLSSLLSIFSISLS